LITALKVFTVPLEEVTSASEWSHASKILNWYMEFRLWDWAIKPTSFSQKKESWRPAYYQTHPRWKKSYIQEQTNRFQVRDNGYVCRTNPRRRRRYLKDIIRKTQLIRGGAERM
jgi:DNA polymerase I-like protein with 3'-5' exonuclease and polymerase domains